MEKLSIVEHIRGSSDLMSLPQAISELLTEMEKPSFSAETLSKIVLKDPSLTSRILKMANSTYYHRFAEIGTVHQAVVLLGVTTVKCLALSSSILNPGRVEQKSGVDTRAFFTYIFTVAAAAEKIAKVTGFKAPEEAFIGGLLHDIGILFFLDHYPKEYRKIIEKKIKVQHVTDAEKQVFDIDHAEVGFHLATKWRLPEHINIAIRDHHSFGNMKKEETFTNIIRLATLLAHNDPTVYINDLEERLSRISQLMDLLELTKDQVDEISSSLLAETVNVARYLGIDIGDIEDMLIKANKEIWRTYLMIENLFKERQELSQKLLQEERSKGAIESKNIALATLSHYLNNATMAIYGRTQIMRKHHEGGKSDQLLEKLGANLDVMEQAIWKIAAVLAEMKEISPIDDVEYYNMSQAMNLDDRIRTRMDQLASDNGLVVPKEAVDLA